MAYVEDRVVHDADSHITEPPGWADDYIDPSLRDRIDALLPRHTEGEPDRAAVIEKLTAKQRDPEYRSRDAEEIMLRKGALAPGAFLREDRPAALDLLGFRSQLVFTSAFLVTLGLADRSDDLDLAYGVARSHNRLMVDFCSVDPRLLPVCYLPLADIERSTTFAAEVIDGGAAAIMIPSACPKHHSPSHIGLDRVWAQAEEAGVPIVLHVGGGTPMNNTYKENGLPPVKDFVGGDGNFS